jgi:hypothetical protein
MQETMVSLQNKTSSPTMFHLLFSAICWTKVAFQTGAKKKELSKEIENRLYSLTLIGKFDLDS